MILQLHPAFSLASRMMDEWIFMVKFSKQTPVVINHVQRSFRKFKYISQ